MALSQRQIGDLNCRIIGPQDAASPPRACVILCHGFGASGDDLVPLAGELARMVPELGREVLFVFPEAPLAVPEVPGGRAWWLIDLEALQRAAAQGEMRQLRQDSPPRLPQARGELIGVIDALRQETGLPLSKFVLGGFSQGSMLATDVALRSEENVGGLIIYSGTLLVESEWSQLAPGHRGLRVLQSHGTIDPLLPFEAAGWLRELLDSAGADVEFLSFPGMHTIPKEAVVSSARLLTDVVTGTSPGDHT